MEHSSTKCLSHLPIILILTSFMVLFSGAAAADSFTISDRTDWNQGNHDGTSADRDAHSGTLGLGYENSLFGGLLGHWRLDDTSSTATDYSGSGNHGTNNGATPGVTGVFGTNAYDFGGNGYVDIGGFDFSSSGEITMAAWVRVTGSESDVHNTDVFHLGSYDIQLFASGTPVKWVTSIENGLAYGNEVETGEWTHLAAVYDGNAVRIYENGQEIGSDSVSQSLSSYSQGAIGGRPTNVRHFPGYIDEAMILDQALTSSEIQELYLNGEPYTGSHTTTNMGASGTQSWNNLEVNVGSTGVSATFRALDSNGNTVDSQDLGTLNSGRNNYSLSVQDSEDAEVVFSGTSSNPESSWEITDATIYYSSNNDDDDSDSDNSDSNDDDSDNDDGSITPVTEYISDFEEYATGSYPSPWEHHQETACSYSDCDVGRHEVINSDSTSGSKSMECYEESNGWRNCFIPVEVGPDTAASFDYKLHVEDSWSTAGVYLYDTDWNQMEELVELHHSGDSSSETVGWNSISNYDLSQYSGETVYFNLRVNGRHDGGSQYAAWVKVDDVDISANSECLNNTIYGSGAVRWITEEEINQNPEAFEQIPDQEKNNGFCAGDDPSEFVIHQRCQSGFCPTDTSVRGVSQSPKSCILDGSQLPVSHDETRIYQPGNSVTLQYENEETISCFDGTWYMEWPISSPESAVTVPLGETVNIPLTILNVRDNSQEFEVRIRESGSDEIKQFSWFSDVGDDREVRKDDISLEVPSEETETVSLSVYGGKNYNADQILTVEAYSLEGDLYGEEEITISVEDSSGEGSNELPGLATIQLIVLVLGSLLAYWRYI